MVDFAADSGKLRQSAKGALGFNTRGHICILVFRLLQLRHCIFSSSVPVLHTGLQCRAPSRVGRDRSYPPSNSVVPSSDGHEVTEQGVGTQEAQADVGGLGPFLKDFGEGEIHGAWTSVHQRHHNLKSERETHNNNSEMWKV